MKPIMNRRTIIKLCICDCVQAAVDAVTKSGDLDTDAQGILRRLQETKDKIQYMLRGDSEQWEVSSWQEYRRYKRTNDLLGQLVKLMWPAEVDAREFTAACTALVAWQFYEVKQFKAKTPRILDELNRWGRLEEDFDRLYRRYDEDYEAMEEFNRGDSAASRMLKAMKEGA